MENEIEEFIEQIWISDSENERALKMKFEYGEKTTKNDILRKTESFKLNAITGIAMRVLSKQDTYQDGNV